MAVTDVNGDRRTLPESIVITQKRITPNGARAVRAASGRSISEMTDEADRMQIVVFLQLLRDGYTPTWDEAGDVGIEGGMDDDAETPDPTSGELSPTSPRSAATGG